MGEGLIWKNTGEMTTEVFKETSSIRKKAVEIEAVYNLLSDEEIGRASIIISNLLLKKFLEALKVRELEVLSSVCESVDTHIVNHDEELVNKE